MDEEKPIKIVNVLFMHVSEMSIEFQWSSDADYRGKVLMDSRKGGIIKNYYISSVIRFSYCVWFPFQLVVML